MRLRVRSRPEEGCILVAGPRACYIYIYMKQDEGPELPGSHHLLEARSRWLYSMVGFIYCWLAATGNMMCMTRVHTVAASISLVTTSMPTIRIYIILTGTCI